MKLFKCHAVMPLVDHDRQHVVKAYVVVAESWEAARVRVRNEEPEAEFVTMPVEKPVVLLAEFTSMSEREVADLRAACNWREEQTPRSGAPLSRSDHRAVGSKA